MLSIWTWLYKILSYINSLPDIPISGSSIQEQIKIWCEKYGQMEKQLSDWVENIVGNGEIAHYEQFLLFPRCFSKAVCSWCVKMSIYGVKD